MVEMERVESRLGRDGWRARGACWREDGDGLIFKQNLFEEGTRYVGVADSVVDTHEISGDTSF